MAAAVIGAAVFIIRTPHLRHRAWRLARQYATGPLAVWVAGTVRGAWDEAATTRPVRRPAELGAARR